jgi:hypothetical protein
MGVGGGGEAQEAGSDQAGERENREKLAHGLGSFGSSDAALSDAA